MTEQEHLWECIALKGECPDCGKFSLQRKGSYVHCRLCRATFFAENLSVQRVKIKDREKYYEVNPRMGTVDLKEK